MRDADDQRSQHRVDRGEVTIVIPAAHSQARTGVVESNQGCKDKALADARHVTGEKIGFGYVETVVDQRLVGFVVVEFHVAVSLYYRHCDVFAEGNQTIEQQREFNLSVSSVRTAEICANPLVTQGETGLKKVSGDSICVCSAPVRRKSTSFFSEPSPEFTTVGHCEDPGKSWRAE